MKIITSLFILMLVVINGTAQNAVCGFEYEKTITINGSQVTGGPHTDFPVLISHTDADLTIASAKVTSASGFDIIFADDNGALLDFQLEKYDGATGQYVAWVKIPSLTNGTDVDIHMLYGKTTITTNQSTTNVWGANYHSVWHLHNDFLDATANGYNGTNNGSTDALGNSFTADGQDFQDPNDWIELNSGTSFPNMTSDFSISAWFETDNKNTTGQRIFCDDANNTNGYALSIGDPGSGGRIRFYTRGTSPVSLDAGPGGIINSNQWHHAVAVADITNSMKYIYIDGVLVASGSYTGSIGTDAGNASIGGEVASGESNNRLDGTLDEVRVVASALSANWISTEFNSQNQPTTTVNVVTAGDFYFVGPENDIFHTTIQDGDWDQTSRWDSGIVPNGQFANVDIQHNIDVDVNSGDYTVCDCNLNSTGAIAVRLDISSTRILTVKGDVNGNLTGSGTSTTAINLTNTAQMNIDGDVNLIRTNTSVSPNLDIQLRDDCIMNITGDVTLNMSAGDDVYIDLEDNSDLNITGDVILIESGGDEVGIVLDDASTLDIAGALSITQSGGDDVRINVNNNAGTTSTFTVTGTTTINKTGGDDINLRTAGASSQLNLNGAITIDCPSGSDTENMIFDANAGQITLAATTASRSLDMGLIDFDLDGGNITVASLSIISSGTLGGDQAVTIDIDEASVFTCTGNLSVTMTGGDDFRVGLNRNGGTAGRFNCNGNLSITQSDGDDINFFIYQSSQFYVGGNMTITQTGGEQLEWDLDDAGQLDIDGNLVISHSQGQNTQIDLQAASTTIFNVDGSFTSNNTGGGDQILIDLNDGQMIVGGDMTLNNSAAGTAEDTFLQIDGDASLTVGGNLTGNLTGGDDLRVDLGNNTANSNASLNCSGIVTLTQNMGVTGRKIRLLLYDNCTFVSRGLTLNQSNTAGSLLLAHLDNTSVMTIAGNIDMNTAGSGEIEIRADNTSELRISGNFDRTPSAFGELDMALTSTLEFFGSTNTQIFPEDAGGGGDIFDYGNVQINNTFGTSPQITMEGLATVHTSILFMDGVVSSGSANLLVIDDNATSSGASDNSHVDGLMRKVGNDAFEFPTGDLGVWAPIEISAPASAVNFDAEYFFFNHADITVLSPLMYRSVVEYWTLTPDAATNVDVTLHWKVASRSGINTFTSDLVVAHYDGADWETYGNDFMTATDPGEIRVNGITTFSPFTFGSLSKSQVTNPLPIELISFSGQVNNDQIDLDWTTASEINNDYFTIEKSQDGINFDFLSEIKGSGTTNIQTKYDDIDLNPINGINYYRLIQTDFNGSSSMSNTIAIEYFSKDVDMVIYPNPNSTGLTNISTRNITGSIEITLYDSFGKSIQKELIYSESVNNKIILYHGNLSKGIYFINLVNDNINLTEKLFIR